MNNSVSIHEVVIGYKVTSVNFAKQVCNVTVFVDRDKSGTGKEQNFKKVKLSSLLAWRLQHQEDRYTIGKWYCGYNTSENRKENPFQIIKYTDKVTFEECLMIAPVEQRSKYTPVSYDAFGNKMVGDIKYRFHKREFYTRWRNLVRTNKKFEKA